MKKSALFFSSVLVALASALNVSAEVNGVRVSDDNQSVIFLLEDRPEVTFSSSDLIITTPDRTIEFPLTSTVNFNFVDTSGVKEISGNAAKFNISGGIISASGLSAGEPISIFSYSGEKVYSSVADANGEWSVSTDKFVGLPLIVKTNNFAYKILIGK